MCSKYMKKTFLLLIISVLGALAGCQSSDNFGELPESVSNFITQYWPDPDISSVTRPGADSLVVTIKNGPTLTFNADNEWTEINGNGLPLPQVVLFDRLPSVLYQYIEAGSYTNQVFSIARTPRVYTAQLLDALLTYDIATATVRQDNEP